MSAAINKGFLSLLLTVTVMLTSWLGCPASTLALPVVFPKSTDYLAPRQQLEQQPIEQQFQNAFAAASTGDFATAERYWTQMIEQTPQNPVAYNNRGNAKARLGEWEGAIADYRTAFELAPGYAIAGANYALALYQVQRPQEAIQLVRTLVRQYPQFADVRAALTALLWVSGQQGEAESHWVAAVGLDSHYRDLEWVAQIRSWPPAMVEALEQFLQRR